MLDLAKKLIILDRDGVINIDSDKYIKSPEEWTPIPKSIEAIVELKKMGFLVFIATNQSGIGRGLFSKKELNQMHEKLSLLLQEKQTAIDGIFYCPHKPEDLCNCRKPKPGLLKEISNQTSIDLQGVPLIGDSLRDLQAGWAMNCESILVKTGKGEKTLKLNGGKLINSLIFEDLSESVEYIKRMLV